MKLRRLVLAAVVWTLVVVAGSTMVWTVISRTGSDLVTGDSAIADDGTTEVVVTDPSPGARTPEPGTPAASGKPHKRHPGAHPSQSPTSSPSLPVTPSSEPQESPSSAPGTPPPSSSTPGPGSGGGTSTGTPGGPGTKPPSSTQPPPTSPSSPAPTANRDSWQGSAGRVVAECSGSTITLVGAQANSGWTVEVGGETKGARIEVHFHTAESDRDGRAAAPDSERVAGEGEVELTAVCSGGKPAFSVG